MKRSCYFVYGVTCYAVFLASAVYGAGFIGGFGTPTSLDATAEGPLWRALLIDLGLLGLFAVQHSVMARAGFKRVWTRVVPPVVEHATYVLASSLALLVLFALWQPLGGTVWRIESTAGVAALYTVFALGWAVLLAATFLIDHFELFGLRQAWDHLRGRETRQHRFVTPGLYRHVRHPIYVGWLLIFWATPNMTVSHLLFALATTGYILVGMRLEERDLVRQFGERYRRYQREVPMLLPFTRGRQQVPAEQSVTVAGSDAA